LPGEELSADRRPEQRQQSAMALARSPACLTGCGSRATLFFVHECSHQDIAVFLDLSVATSKTASTPPV
jgi:hypothetical protein